MAKVMHESWVFGERKKSFNSKLVFSFVKQITIFACIAAASAGYLDVDHHAYAAPAVQYAAAPAVHYAAAPAVHYAAPAPILKVSYRKLSLIAVDQCIPF